MGPFLDLMNTDISSGEISYDGEKGKVFLTHDQLFQELIKMIATELNGVNTKVVFAPSHKDIMHFEVLP
jgi:hypothetical protein